MVNEPFTASNGVTLQPRETLIDWRMEDLGGVLNFNIGTVVDNALAEWYQHRRDVELGRWRDPENPDHLVYQSDPYVQGYRRIAVVNERDMASVHMFSEGAGKHSSDPKALTAQRYFVAHPDPKPWHDAKPGEVWVLETELHPEPRAFKVSSREGYATSNFTQVYNGQPLYTFRDGAITAGRRIWPEESDDE